MWNQFHTKIHAPCRNYGPGLRHTEGSTRSELSASAWSPPTLAAAMAPKKSKSTPAEYKTGPTTWMVEYHWQAVEDLKGFSDREQKGVLTVADFLRQLGTKIKEPHMKPITGEKKIRELRPSGGRVLVRPLYFQADERTFKIVAIAPESRTDPSGFGAAVRRARDRAKRDYGVEI